MHSQVPANGPDLSLLSLAHMTLARHNNISKQIAVERTMRFTIQPPSWGSPRPFEPRGKRARIWRQELALTGLSAGFVFRRSRLFPFPIGFVISVLGSVTAELAVLKLPGKHVISLGCFQTDFKNALLECCGSDFHPAFRRRDGAGDLLAVLLEHEGKRRVALRSTVRLAFPSTRQRPRFGFLFFAKYKSGCTPHDQTNANRTQDAPHVPLLAIADCRPATSRGIRQRKTCDDSTAVLSSRPGLVKPGSSRDDFGLTQPAALHSWRFEEERIGSKCRDPWAGIVSNAASLEPEVPRGINQRMREGRS